MKSRTAAKCSKNKIKYLLQRPKKKLEKRKLHFQAHNDLVMRLNGSEKKTKIQRWNEILNILLDFWF